MLFVCDPHSAVSTRKTQGSVGKWVGVNSSSYLSSLSSVSDTFS